MKHLLIILALAFTATGCQSTYTPSTQEELGLHVYTDATIKQCYIRGFTSEDVFLKSSEYRRWLTEDYEFTQESKDFMDSIQEDVQQYIDDELTLEYCAETAVIFMEGWSDMQRYKQATRDALQGLMDDHKQRTQPATVCNSQVVGGSIRTTCK
ncbi:hypothetical protein L2735_14125 [Shewanella olleyana]|uniref:hypothetical protein n=1 Tax=Shewanella olleyana TaxID=135626 RepID=UPI00200E1138|nr:hypothetical protein [Shewanella olleyana]MCL1067928.1 hypothetical protein [Shewanella olleyana]